MLFYDAFWIEWHYILFHFSKLYQDINEWISRMEQALHLHFYNFLISISKSELLWLQLSILYSLYSSSCIQASVLQLKPCYYSSCSVLCNWYHSFSPTCFFSYPVSITVLPFTRWISIPVCNKRHHRQYRFMTFSCSHQIPYVCPHWSLPNLTWTNSVSLLNTLLAYQPDRLFTGSFSLIAIQVLNLRPLILTPKQTLHPSHLIIIPSQQSIVFLFTISPWPFWQLSLYIDIVSIYCLTLCTAVHNKVIVFSIHRKCSITGVVYDTPSKINSISLLENVISLPFASPPWQSACRSLFCWCFLVLC